MTSAELAPIVLGMGGLRAAARTFGCGVATLHRYLGGERAVPIAIAEQARGFDPDREVFPKPLIINTRELL